VSVAEAAVAVAVAVAASVFAAAVAVAAVGAVLPEVAADVVLGLLLRLSRFSTYATRCSPQVVSVAVLCQSFWRGGAAMRSTVPSALD
jgi:hypothetical protein